MAEIELPPPTVGGDRGTWGAETNALWATTSGVLTDHDNRLDEDATTLAEHTSLIAGLEEGVGAPTDAGMAALVADPESAVAGAVSAKNFQGVTVTYDGDNIASVTDGPATTTFTYVGDLVDTDSTVIGSTTINRQYVYDGAGNLTAIEVI